LSILFYFLYQLYSFICSPVSISVQEYGCEATFAISVSSENFKVFSIKGNHNARKANQDVTIIKLSSQIDHFPSNIGAHFPNARRIYARKNNLKSLVRENFKFIGKLQDLLLEENQISVMEEDTFTDLRNLAKLELGQNKIRKLPKKLLWRSKQLQHFWAHENEIESLDKDFFSKNKNLMQVNLWNNKIESVHPESFKLLNKLKYLYLGGNRISELDENIFHENVQLEVLYLGSNKIKVLPKKLLWTLKNLDHFNAGINQIEVIDRDLFLNNKVVQYLTFSVNKLKIISVDFTKLLKIKQVDLRANTCIDLEFRDDNNAITLTEIQQAINTNCS